MPQTEDVDWNFPVLVEDVVMMGRYGKMNFLRIPSREDRLRVDKALERVGLERAAQPTDRRAVRRPEKRVFLARALAQQGTVLLLDEPFTGVDVKPRTPLSSYCALRDEGHLIPSPPITSAACRSFAIG